ncbi:MAG: hypothetical protein JNL30_20145 [Rubrivivax sp.]|nr:hypothetical protein [Rubrivivax sp.]
MKMPAGRNAVLALVICGAGGWATAQDSGLERDLRRCRAIADSLARIVCYDAIALPGAGAAASAAPVPVAAAPVVGVVPPAAAPASASPPVGSNAMRDFGLPERAAAQQLQFVESTIQGDFDGWTPGARVRLANGQLWEVVDGSTASYAQQRNPKVRIERGWLGSYFMNVEGVAHIPRVRRLQ